MKKVNFNSLLCGACLCVFLFFLCSISLRVVTRVLLVKTLGISNAFTRIAFYGAEELQETKEERTEERKDSPPALDWEALYPFDEPPPVTETQPEQDNSLFDEWERKAFSLEGKLRAYSTQYLIGYDTFTELAKSYRGFLRWNYASFSEYNGVVKLSDGYLTSFKRRLDVSSSADALTDFAQYCKEKGTDFLYLQAPHKICRYTDYNISGSLDFSNQNADALLEALNGAGVETYDFRQVIHEENLDHHALFYKTDHHWRGETGLWAAGQILEYLRERGYDTDASVLDEDLFRKETYPAWFLGSHGKKATLALTEPDDFTLLYPEYPTELRFELPELNIDRIGDFSTLYDMSQINERDYYNKNPYLTYAYGDRALERIENLKADNDIKALLIHDSFGNCVLPFLALDIRHMDSIDLRHFMGSLKRYIKDSAPDIVMVMYNPTCIVEEVSLRTSTFYFE